MRKRSLFLWLPLCAALLCGCTKTREPDTHTIYAMDTVMTLSIYDDRPDSSGLLNQAAAEIRRLDGLLDRGADGSDIKKLNQNPDSIVSEDTAGILKTALSLCASTNGAFDITIAPVMDLWGFYGQNPRIPSPDQLSEALSQVDYRRIRQDGAHILSGGAQIDLGGIGKGYTGDRIAALFKAQNVQSALLSLGGNVHAIGTKPDGKPWRISIQDPADSREVIGTADAVDQAVVTSGGYQRFFEQDGGRYHHIIDPTTGYPAESGLTSVTVIASSGALADGLSTALFVMGLDRGADYWRSRRDFGAVWVKENGEIFITENLSEAFQSPRNVLVVA